MSEQKYMNHNYSSSMSKKRQIVFWKLQGIIALHLMTRAPPLAKHFWNNSRN